MKQKQLFDTSAELCIQRCQHGIKLVRPNLNQHHQDKTLSVADVLAFPFNAYFLDSDSIIRNANEGTAYTQSFISVTDAIGKSVRDALQPRFANVVLNEDKTVIETKNMVVTENYGARKDDIEIQCLTLKFPLYSQENKVMGVFGFSIMDKTFKKLSIAQSLTILFHNGFLGWPCIATKKNTVLSLSGIQLNGIYLTNRETEVAELLVQGKTARAIAEQLNRSTRTIEHIIERMKDKTDCASKFELVEMIVNDWIKD